MSTRTATSERIQQCGTVAVVRVTDREAVGDVVAALIAGGVIAIEITMTVPGAVGIIEKLAPELPQNVLLGAGTVLEPDTARHVIRAGARFVVSPVLDAALIEATLALGAVAIPGCFTPTEIRTAMMAGADIVKVFPAGAVGPRYFKDVLAPLPDARLMPTGGVTLANAGEWIEAGAVAVGIGTALLDPVAIRERRFELISSRARQLVDAVARARAGRHAPASEVV